MDEPVGNTSEIEQIKSDVLSFMNLVPGKKIDSVGAFLGTILNAVRAVERVAGHFAGADKKSIVVWIVNQYVHVPLVPQVIIDDVAYYLIDSFVNWLNGKLGQDWTNQLNG